MNRAKRDQLVRPIKGLRDSASPSVARHDNFYSKQLKRTGKEDREHRAFAQLALDGDGAVHALHDVLDD